MAAIIAVANCKGGVAKTTTSVAIADNLARRGKKVLFIDTDPQRNSTKVYGAKTEDVSTLYDIIFSDYKAKDCIQNCEKVDVIASDELLQTADTQVPPGPKMYKYIKNAISGIKSKYDYIVIDTPPRTGILLGNVLMATDYIIIPVTCDSFGVQGILDFYNTVKEYKSDNKKLKILGLLKIKYKGRQNLTRDIEDNLLPEFAKEMGTKVFDQTIRESVRCQEAQTLSLSLFDYAPNCTTAQDYDAFVEKEIVKEGI